MINNLKKEESKIEETKKGASTKITYDDFKKVEIKIGKILSVERLEKSEKLLKLSVDFGPKLSNDLPEGSDSQNRDIRQIISGIAKYFPNIDDLIGKKCPFVTNLEPKPLMGFESNGMILAVGGGEDSFSLFEVQAESLIGKQIK